MAEICVVCNIFNSQMMNICQHPKDLGFKLEFVLGYQAQENDFLCYMCCEELIIAFNFKEKCLQSKLNRPEFSTIGQNQNETSGNNSLKYSQSPNLLRVKIEPNFKFEDNLLRVFPDDDDNAGNDYCRKYFKREKSVDITADIDQTKDGKSIEKIEESEDFSKLTEQLGDGRDTATSKVPKTQFLQQKLYRTR